MAIDQAWSNRHPRRIDHLGRFRKERFDIRFGTHSDDSIPLYRNRIGRIHCIIACQNVRIDKRETCELGGWFLCDGPKGDDQERNESEKNL